MKTPVPTAYQNTDVSPHRSKDQIETLLGKVNAVGFRWYSTVGANETLEAGLDFQGRQRAFRLSVDFKDERERRQKLRALYWYLKSKIEAVVFGLVDLEQEFLPYLIVQGGETVYEHLGGQNMRLLLPPPSENGDEKS